MKVLFVCRANIFRSQIAEAYFRRYCPEHEVESVGTKIRDDRIGWMLKRQTEVAVKLILDVMKEDGIDMSKNKRKALTPELVGWADKIICMAQRDTIPHYLERKGYEYWAVEDASLDTDREFFVQTREEIKGLVKKFVKEIS